MHRRRLYALVGALILTLAATIATPLAVQAGGGCHAMPDSVYTEGSSTVVKTDVCSFVPTVIRVPVGSRIRFLNSDTQDHMVVGRAGTWASDVLSPGQEFVATFTAKGTFPYSCPLHPGMVGAVVVGDGIGLAGGAAVGVPESVVSDTRPSPSPTTAPSVAPSTSAASTAAASPAPVATQPARSDAPLDRIGAAAVVLAAVAGVIGGVVGGRFVGRRRPGAATR